MSRVSQLLSELESPSNEGTLTGAKGTKAFDNSIISNGGSQEFKEFLPFEQAAILPPFPLESLPAVTREFVYFAAESIQAPLDLVASCVLGVLEIACRGRYPIKLPNGHVERPCLYIAPIAPPSERKSGVIDVVTRPLIDYEIEYNEIHGGEVNQSESELRLIRGSIGKAEQRAIKAKDGAERQAAVRELQELNAELAEFEQVEPLRLFGADVTPEKLAAMLKAQGGTFALVSAEGGGLFENIGRYSDKGGLELYLNGYSGDRIHVDRKTSESIVIDRPTLSIIAPCQPSVITDLFDDKQKAGRGLLSRILFVKCRSVVGKRKVVSAPICERIATNYNNLCQNMLSAENKGDLTYDSGGFEAYSSFFNEVEPQLTTDEVDEGELAFMGDWAGKAVGCMTRFAGLIHCINAFEQGKNPLDTKINADEATAAVEIARFYLDNAKAVYIEESEPKDHADAKYLWGRIQSIKKPKFAKRELTRKTQGKRDFDLKASLELLKERGYIDVGFSSSGNAGRPKEIIFLNPATENIVTKLTKSHDNENKVNFVNLVTTNLSVPSTKSNITFGVGRKEYEDENLTIETDVSDDELPFFN